MTASTASQVRLFNARIERVVSPNVVDAYVGLGMGVMILKRVTIDHAPGVPRPSRPNADINPDDTFPATNDEAMQCLIVLCGGKRVRIEMQEDTNDFHVVGRIGVRAKEPPEYAKWAFGSDFALLDVGRMMKHLADTRDYDVATVRSALNGPQRHTSRP